MQPEGRGRWPASEARAAAAADRPHNLIHRNKSPNPVTARAPARLTMPEAAWNQGFQDGMFRRERCPFPAMSRDAWAWSSGYIEGRANAKT